MTAQTKPTARSLTLTVTDKNGHHLHTEVLTDKKREASIESQRALRAPALKEQYGDCYVFANWTAA